MHGAREKAEDGLKGAPPREVEGVAHPIEPSQCGSAGCCRHRWMSNLDDLGVEYEMDELKCRWLDVQLVVETKGSESLFRLTSLDYIPAECPASNLLISTGPCLTWKPISSGDSTINVDTK
jgi:hypothetical protein